MEPQENKNGLFTFIYSTKAIVGKLFIMMSPLYYIFQTSPDAAFWEKIANISIALFVLMVGIYILWKEYRRQDQYSKKQNERIIEMAERTAQLAESSTRATENSTQAIRNMTQSMERVFNRLDKME